MQKLKLLIPLALLICAFFVACHESDPFDNTAYADVTFAGRIIDEIGEGIEGAQVKAGDESVFTDKNGVFRLKSVRVVAMHALITVSKDGFFEVSRPYIVEDEALQTVTIQLLTKVFEGSINAVSGGEITVQGGPKLKFPANAFIDASGNPFNGQANVYARYLDPAHPNLGLFVPGDMTAENATNDEVFLATFGMIGVEIVTGNGQKLNLASGKEVQLRMPISPSQLAFAPAEIPLWHYDLEEGHWKEEGSAQKVGNEYIGQVAHFSFWNCDAPFPLTQLHGKIYLENTDQPLANALVRLTMISTGGQSFGYTDANGNFGGCIPKDQALKLEIEAPSACGGQILYAQDIGPFAAESTLPPIIIPPSTQIPVIKVTGSLLDCNGQPVTNGYVKVTLGNSTSFTFPNAGGQFGYAVADCDPDPKMGQVIGYDLTNLLESAPAAFSTPPNTIDVGALTVCSALTEFIHYTLDGQSFTHLWTTASINVDSLPGGTFNTVIWGASANQQESINFYFRSLNQIGSYPIQGFFVTGVFEVDMAQSDLNVTVTDTGNVGDLLIGTFGGNIKALDGTSHMISGSYRMIRDQ